jgi:hypothetical protein
MADDNSSAEHIKNPGRVAWGRKLARMSRESKAEKKAKLSGPVRSSKQNDEKIEKLIQKNINIDTETKSMLDLHRIEVIVGILAGDGGLIALYLNYKSNKSVQPSCSEGSSRPNPPQTVAPNSAPTLIEQYDYRNGP